ncbi:cytoplasmic dynein 2 intermediate chain 2-like [Argopecten irradians]|uniref:cytoplasmic dynein 2 intermediate chain 2-like n=1 Tax=Argopecten irradians TaxID=31199 RepID=UPI0037139C98
MFNDKVFEAVSFRSSWKKERSLADGCAQTDDLETFERASQSVKRRDKEVQTDDDGQQKFRLAEDTSGRLGEFLARMEPVICRELNKNLKSHAFDDFITGWDEELASVSCVHKLTNPEINGELHITGVTWNSTGAVIAASYGRYDHEDWCTHKSALCTWNLERRNINENKPDTVIDLSTCLTCVAFHPKNPAIIAGGTYDGEIMMWDLSREDDMLVTSSGIGDDAHREPVTRVHWIPDNTTSKRDRYLLVSTSGDGKILVWKHDRKKDAIKLSNGFILMAQNLPKELKKSRGIRGDKEVGVTCLSYNCEDKDAFLLGSEPGAVFRCSMMAQGEPAGSHIISSVQLHSPVTFTYNPHHAPVYSTEFSPFHRNAFLSSSMDQTIRLYSMLQKQPVLTIEPGEGFISSTKWSPVRPSLIAATTESGYLLLYDLKNDQPVPIQKLEASIDKTAVHTCQFNPNQFDLIATGDGAGYVHVFRLSQDLKTANSKDIEAINVLVDIES